MIFRHNGFSNVSPNYLLEQMHSRISCIWRIFLQSGFYNVSSNCLGKVTRVAFEPFFPEWIFKCVLKLPARADAKSQELHLNRGKVTLFAFKGLFSRENFRMCPEIAWLSRGRVTMVAFKGFSNVFWNYLIEQRQSHIICIRMTFFLSGFLDILSKSQIEQKQSHTASIWGTFLQSEFSDVS